MQRKLVRGLLVLAFAAAVSAIVVVVAFPTLLRAEALAVVAAGLAIIPAILATWSGQRMVELEEDSNVAFPYPTFDVRSRYMVLQLRMTNYGNSLARNVYLKWSEQLEVRDGASPPYLTETVPLPVLLPNESVSFFVDSPRDFVKKYGHADFNGTVHFSDASGQRQSHPFILSSSKFKESLTFDEESPMTHHELQKLPERLREIGNAVKDISKSLDRLTPSTTSSDAHQAQE